MNARREVMKNEVKDSQVKIYLWESHQRKTKISAYVIVTAFRFLTRHTRRTQCTFAADRQPHTLRSHLRQT